MRKELIKRRFTKSLSTYHQKAMVQRRIAKRLGEMALDYLPVKMDKVLEIGYGTGLLTEEILTRFDLKTLYLNDLVEHVPVNLKHLISERNATTSIDFLLGDAEKISFPDDMDAILSSSTVQWLDDKPTFIQKSHTALRPGGMLIFNTFGPNNLAEVRELTGQGLHYPSVSEWKEWMEMYFTDVKITHETIVTNFDSPRDLLRHLRSTGVTATTPEFRWTKSTFMDFQEKYYERYLEKGKVSLTWDVIYVKGRKK
jgi:malonyl-CoA O-methyltransferase